MAHIETTHTGSQVVTYVRGRVFRNGRIRPNFSARPRSSRENKEHRRVCVLTVHAAAQLENWSINQPCYGDRCHHRHWTRQSVSALVDTGQMRWVGRGRNVATWVEAREWRPKQSGGTTTLQLVPIGSGMSRLQQREDRLSGVQGL